MQMADAGVPDGGAAAQLDDAHCCERMALVFKALGNATRLGILRHMMDRRICVSELQDELDRSQPNISQHLAVLRDRGVVLSEREGNRVCYRLADARIALLLEQAAAVFDVGDPAARTGGT